MDLKGHDPQAGRLLVATPLLGDPNFRRTVILVVEHEEVQGTLGVVLNRPTKIPVGQVLDQWTEPDHRPARWCSTAARSPAAARWPWPSCPAPMSRSAGVPSMAPPHWPASGCLTSTRRRACLLRRSSRCASTPGYAGWSPGQLESEIDEGAWYVVTAEPGDVFAVDPDALWRTVLRRQEGDLAFLATYPDDPSLN